MTDFLPQEMDIIGLENNPDFWAMDDVDEHGDEIVILKDLTKPKGSNLSTFKTIANTNNHEQRRTPGLPKESLIVRLVLQHLKSCKI